MFLRAILIAAAFTVGVARTACGADLLPHGAYVCTVEQKAGIGEEHQEGAPPPATFVDHEVTRFRISVSGPAKRARSGGRFRVEEKPYSGADRDPQAWQTKNAVLHGVYRGDGWKFAGPDQALLRFDIASTESGWLFFYHAGFEKPDVDHINLSVRWGTCAPVK